jgi:site-specific DNA-methyltransferase (adenine-specific)
MIYCDLPDKKYSIIYADPPWSYRDKSKHRGGAEKHYPTLSVKEICSLQVKDIAADNSVLFLWCTFPRLPDVFSVINSWGFTYKTAGFVWVKTNKDGTIFKGMGHYTRANSEVCFLATRGSILKRLDRSISSVLVHRRLKHSEKPPAARNKIVELFGDLDRVELFAREKVDGWDAWGIEVV